MIPGKRCQRATAQGFAGAGLVEFTRANLLPGQPRKDFLVRVSCRINQESGMAFYRNQANMTLRAQTFMKCE